MKRDVKFVFFSSVICSVLYTPSFVICYKNCIIVRFSCTIFKKEKLFHLILQLLSRTYSHINYACAKIKGCANCIYVHNILFLIYIIFFRQTDVNMFFNFIKIYYNSLIFKEA